MYGLYNWLRRNKADWFKVRVCFGHVVGGHVPDYTTEICPPPHLLAIATAASYTKFTQWFLAIASVRITTNLSEGW